MKGINKVILVGQAGQDPETRTTTSGVTVTNLSIATNKTLKGKNGEPDREETEWHKLVFFNKLAEIVRDYVKKGSRIYVEGENRTRKWTDDNGIERPVTEIVCNEMQLLDRKEA